MQMAMLNARQAAELRVLRQAAAALEVLGKDMAERHGREVSDLQAAREAELGPKAVAVETSGNYRPGRL